jgi:hypothetical protein
MFVFLLCLSGMQSATFLRSITFAICGLPRSTTFFPHYLTNGTIFGKKVYWT